LRRVDEVGLQLRDLEEKRRVLPGSQIERACLEVVDGCGSDRLAVLQGLLRHEDSQFRAVACRSARYLGKDSLPLAGEIMRLASIPNIAVGSSAHVAIVGLGSAVEDIVFAALESEDKNLRIAAIRAFGEFDCCRPDTLDALARRMLLSEDDYERSKAGQAVKKHCRGRPQIVPALLAAAGHADANVRYSVAECFGLVGCNDGPVIAALEKFLEDWDTAVRDVAKLSLKALESK
jgi:HEAT repeat protein